MAETEETHASEPASPDEAQGAEAEVETEEVSEAAPAPGGLVLRGASVAPGLVLGTVHRKDYDLSRMRAQRVALEEVDRELNRFRSALDASRHQLADLKARLQGRVKPEDARILDTHVTYLKDSVFIADVENLILNEQMSLEAAITKVISDFDRIFRLVQNETLRQSAVDLRDVGIRVLRNLEQGGSPEDADEPVPQDYILVARELSIVDMFNLSNEHVLGIATEGGGLTSHAAIFARSMRIPTVTGVEGLLDAVGEGDFVILDAAEGLLRVNPDDLVRQQYAGATPTRTREGVPSLRQSGTERTRDGVEVQLSASCGNLPEVEEASSLGMRGVGLYRTELLYLIEREPPTREALVGHYAAVIDKAGGVPVTFRLLNVDSGLEVPYLFQGREKNPGLGRAGVRLLLDREPLLRRQLRALCLASLRSELRIAAPLITDCGELRRLKEILFEERFELRKTGETHQERVSLGAVVETPAAILGIEDLAREVDFLTINLDSLVQYLLAADRENSELSSSFESLHPFVVRALERVVRVCEAAGKELSVFGVMAEEPSNLLTLLGTGLRSFCVPPEGAPAFVEVLGGLSIADAERSARNTARSACPADARSVVGRYHHGQPSS